LNGSLPPGREGGERRKMKITNKTKVEEIIPFLTALSSDIRKQRSQTPPLWKIG
jgi:hypothetical protein